jgi:hypothetical protein
MGLDDCAIIQFSWICGTLERSLSNNHDVLEILD